MIAFARRNAAAIAALATVPAMMLVTVATVESIAVRFVTGVVLLAYAIKLIAVLVTAWRGRQ
ncbi:MAG: hypothetical protein ACM31L_08480 [Actinomycetota bacterium]